MRPESAANRRRGALDRYDISAAVRAVRDAMLTTGTNATYFEALLTAALVAFRQRRAHIVVCEVGIGGLLDPTNALPHIVSIITTVGNDHRELLGPTIREIAFNKAGIIADDAPVVVGPVSGTAMTIIRAVAQAHHAPLCRARGRQACSTRLAGRFQQRNAAAAIEAVRVLRRKGWRIPPSAVRAGLRAAWLPARMELLRGKPSVLLDGAHNEEKVQALVAELRSLRRQYRAVHGIFGCLAAKQSFAMIRLLAPLLDTTLVTRATVTGKEFADPDRLARQFRHAGGRAIGVELQPAAALWRAVSAILPDDLVVITGSLYLVGALRHEARSMIGA